MAKKDKAAQSASKEVEVRNIDDIERLDAERLAGDTRKVMSTEEGQRVMWWILETCGIHRTSMTGNSYTYFNEGQRNIGLMLEDHLIDVSDKDFLKMRDKAIARAKNRNQVIEALRKAQENEEDA